jgi:hypothetical protein
VKTLIKKSAPIILILTATFLFGFGCNPSKPAIDPLSGWQKAYNEEPNQIINKDLNDFIKQLSPEGNRYVYVIGYYKDGTGQHAINFEIFEAHENSSWHYALFYDKNGKRTKVVKYDFRKYQS